MSKDEIDRLIAKNMAGDPSSESIDIRKQTMARISSYQKKKEKIRHVFYWALSFFVGIGSLAAIVVYENLFNRLAAFLRLIHMNPLTLKLIYQGFFGLVFLIVFLLMMDMLSSREDFSSIFF